MSGNVHGISAKDRYGVVQTYQESMEPAETKQGDPTETEETEETHQTRQRQ